MPTFRQRCHAVWGNTQAQDIAEYVAILGVILLLVIGTVKLIGKRHGRNPVAIPAVSTH